MDELKSKIAEQGAYIQDILRRLEALEKGEHATGVYFGGAPEYVQEFINHDLTNRKKDGDK